MAFSKVILNGTTLMDVTNDTVATDNLLTGYTATGADGLPVVGSAGGGSQPKVFVKLNGMWTQFSKVYKKVNGSWVEQSSSTWSTLFNTNTNYRKMN